LGKNTTGYLQTCISKLIEDWIRKFNEYEAAISEMEEHQTLVGMELLFVV
jgi:hypothetical protein